MKNGERREQTKKSGNAFNVYDNKIYSAPKSDTPIEEQSAGAGLPSVKNHARILI